MSRPGRVNPWLAAVLAWLLASGLIALFYAIWMKIEGEPLRWDLVGEAALAVIPLALFLAWRERRRER